MSTADPSPAAGTSPTPGPRRKRWILAARVLGFAVVLLSVRWIVVRLGADGAQLAAYRPRTGFYALLALAVPAWAALGLLPAFAWQRLLAVLAGDDADRRRDLRIFTRLQISKYLPGHAFQVARHAVTRSHGAPHTALAAAATCEALGMILAAAALSLIGFGLAFASDAIGLGFEVPRHVLLWAPAVALAVVLAFPWLLSRLAGSRWLPGVVPHDRRALLPSVGLYGLHFASAGLLLGGFLLATSTGDADPRAALLAGLAAYPLAWLTGYLTPATPAGAGAVEAVLVATLGARFGAVETLAAALGLRLAMVCGDVLLAGVAYLAADRLTDGSDTAMPAPRTPATREASRR